MTEITHRRLLAKALQFEKLYRRVSGKAVTVEFGEDAPDNFFVTIRKNYPDGTPNNYHTEFPALASLEDYFNQKITLFKGMR